MGKRSRRKRSRDSDESDEDARLSDEHPNMSRNAKRVSDEELTSRHAILDAVGPHAEQDTAASAHGVPAALQSFVGHALLGEYGSVGAANAGPMEALHAAAEPQRIASELFVRRMSEFKGVPATRYVPHCRGSVCAAALSPKGARASSCAPCTGSSPTWPRTSTSLTR